MVKTLLSVSKDSKTVKGEKLGILTGILYLAPANISGFEVCPKSTQGCRDACLFTAGRGVYANVHDARVNKTKLFFEDREMFMHILVKDIHKLIRKAKREGLAPAVRLNGTSDIGFEKIAVVVDDVAYRSIMKAFPRVQFYDYTKVIGRNEAIDLPNYHLTFSLAEDNDNDAFKAIKQGYNVAVVMKLKKSDSKPETWMGYPVLDGDESDVRFNDPKGGYIVALTAKGKARTDTTGFVRSPNLIAKSV